MEAANLFQDAWGADPRHAVAGLNLAEVLVALGQREHAVSTLPRKGFDLLLKAYRQVFCDRDDVCLIVKDMGVGTFYQGQTAQAQIEQVRRLPYAPQIEYLADELSDVPMAALYRACDVVVQPFRGEGFCLPVAEAMASGKPVIVTGYGPVLDYATEQTAYLLPFGIEPCGEKRIGDLETVDTPFWAVPDQNLLRQLLRYVYEHPEEPREHEVSRKNLAVLLREKERKGM